MRPLWRFFLLCEFFHFFLEKEGVDEFGDDGFIFFGEFADAVELVDECFIPDMGSTIILKETWRLNMNSIILIQDM